MRARALLKLVVRALALLLYVRARALLLYVPFSLLAAHTRERVMI